MTNVPQTTAAVPTCAPILWGRSGVPVDKATPWEQIAGLVKVNIALQICEPPTPALPFTPHESNR